MFPLSKERLSPDLEHLTLMPHTFDVSPSSALSASPKSSALLVSSIKPKALPQFNMNNKSDHLIHYNDNSNIFQFIKCLPVLSTSLYIISYLIPHDNL